MQSAATEATARLGGEGGVDTTIKHATVAAGMVAALMYGGIIVVLLWMNGAMAMMMMTTTPTLQNSGLGGRRE